MDRVESSARVLLIRLSKSIMMSFKLAVIIPLLENLDTSMDSSVEKKKITLVEN